MTEAAEPAGATKTTCYRHPDRPAGVRCQRCDRFICPSCMNTAAVGFHCPECTKSGKQKVYTSSSMWASRPTLTYGLMAINVALFVVGVALGDSLDGRFSIPGVLPDGLLAELAANGSFIDAENEWYRIITSGFMHFGIFHIALNMYALYVVGPTVERSLGRLRFGLLYFAALIGGSFGALLLEPDSFGAGASGALFGLMGALVAGQRSLGIDIWRSGLGTILAINLVLTFGIRNLSVGGHLGGLVIGYACGWAIYELPRRARHLPRYGPEAIMATLGVLCFVGAILAAGRWELPWYQLPKQ